MRKIGIKKITKETFEKFGTYGYMINPNSIKIGEEPIEFYRDLVQLVTDGRSLASFSVCKVHKREMIIDTCEYHSFTGEGIMHLDGDVLIHVGPATIDAKVPIDELEVFLVPKGTFISLKPGVWHHAPFTLNSSAVNVLIVLPERTYANDCKVIHLEENQQIRIEV